MTQSLVPPKINDTILRHVSTAKVIDACDVRSMKRRVVDVFHFVVNSGCIHLFMCPAYPVAICQVCHIGVSVEGIDGHLSGSKHQNVPKDERRHIMDTFRRIPGIIQDEKGLQEFPFPPPTTQAISLLGDAKTDGMRCKQCSYISRHRHQIQEHCRVQHQWENPRKRGRESRQKRRARENGEVEMPWVSNVRCQRFFNQGYGSRWFEVDRVGDQEVDGSGERVTDPGQIMMEQKQKITSKWLCQVKAKTKQTIESRDESKEPNLWLRRVRWVEHLASYDCSRLIESTLTWRDHAKEKQE